MPQVGPLELVIVLVIVLVIFGPKRLPSLGRQLGGGIREFKDSITDRHGDGERDADEPRPALHHAEASADPARSDHAHEAAPPSEAPPKRPT